MATTALWRIHGYLGNVVIYAENPEKTANPKCYEKSDMTAEQAQGLSDVIDYARQNLKTALHDENAEIMKRFVSGVNCNPETARNEMMAVKAHFGKTDGVVAYHGYQSFAPGEATPETAHEIGVKLAERLWGDKYQVLVTTHLDKENHLHNHFIINTVSHIDGKKFYRSEKDYQAMRRESDALCREYGLSVVENPKQNSRQYSEWQAERDGKQTWRGLVKSDVDAAIRQSSTERQFWDNLKKQGYEIKFGKDVSVRPPGKERFVRLFRNFGDDYTVESIRRRILSQKIPKRQRIPEPEPPKPVRMRGTRHRPLPMTRLRALYFYYLYRMGVLPKKREPNPKRVYFLLREDIRFVQRISQEAQLLAEHGIDTAEQLAEHKAGLKQKIGVLYERRRRLRNQSRGIQDDDKLSAVKSEIAAITEDMRKLGREVRLCEEIETRSAEMPEKLREANEAEKINDKDKEMLRNEHIIRRG